MDWSWKTCIEDIVLSIAKKKKKKEPLHNVKFQAKKNCSEGGPEAHERQRLWENNGKY